MKALRVIVAILSVCVIGEWFYVLASTIIEDVERGGTCTVLESTIQNSPRSNSPICTLTKMRGRITSLPQSYRFGYMLAYQQDVPVGETIVPLTSGACLVKVLILSVHSQYCELIGNERKWYEVRTKLPKGIVEVK